jgi:atypical dual specificity phosphatase
LGTGGLFLRKVRASWTDEPTGFVWLEKDRIAASGYPASKKQLLWLSRQGVKSILTLTESPLPEDWLAGLPLEFRHIPMKDHLPPDVQSLAQAAAYIAEQADTGRAILVHCLAGRGRTMCALAAYLIRSKGLGADEAIRQLRKVRAGAVESQQEDALYKYAATIKK